jgi:hypothetical protein
MNKLLGPRELRITWSSIQVFLRAILLGNALREITPVQHGPFQSSCSLTSDEVSGVVPSKAVQLLPSYYVDILQSKGRKRVIYKAEVAKGPLL